MPWLNEVCGKKSIFHFDKIQGDISTSLFSNFNSAPARHRLFFTVHGLGQENVLLLLSLCTFVMCKAKSATKMEDKRRITNTCVRRVRYTRTTGHQKKIKTLRALRAHMKRPVDLHCFLCNFVTRSCPESHTGSEDQLSWTKCTTPCCMQQ